MQELAEQELPRTMAAEWTELAFLQLQAGNTAMYFFVLVVVFVFLVLAAQYESWELPLAVILVVLMCLLCSLVGLQIARMEVTIFMQIGFVVLVALAPETPPTSLSLEEGLVEDILRREAGGQAGGEPPLDHGKKPRPVFLQQLTQ